MNQRVVRLQDVMRQKGIEALLLTNRRNCYYISNFTGSSGVILLTKDDAYLLTDFRYLSQVKEQSPDFTVVEHLGNQMYPKVAETCKSLGVSSLHFEPEYLSYAEYQELSTALGQIALEPLGSVMEQIRGQKEDKELSCIQKAIHIAEDSFRQLLTELRPGMTEKQVALRLEWLMRERGASGVSFDMIVASGIRSALPHGVASDKSIEKGDLVTFDFGCYYQGYVSDITRTIAIGHCSNEQRVIYEIVLAANEKAIEGIVPGIQARDADAIARDFIEQAGYADCFGHGTGHGIGLDIHEFPRLGMTSEDILLPGMVVTVEPGIYLKDRFGVRIEDDILITPEGNKVLTSLPKELIIL
ncbi:aminopeptidase P family protein [Shimazuella sp. AN120528]|uniref:M24 family metallopeptidase n=1 Tax=Shimazuella soli TaxID=1892854 RepID=UPI001F0E5A6F|nr:aminopeptidase P family protein [Shimazuella soli]MCH5584159.1 aminopeptidase P family protein [Shimazuella soli]